MKKKLSLLLALMLIFALFAGCSKDNAEKTETPAPASDTDEPAASAPAASAEPAQELNAVKLPLTTDPATFVMWTLNGTTFDGFADYNDNEVYKEMEKRSGVHLDFIHPTAGSENENFQLLMASQDIPDFLHTINTYYIGGMDKAIEDQTIYALNDFAKMYMPNYMYRLNINEDVKRQSLTDKGNLWGVHHVVDRPQGAFYGLGIRQDWLDKEGLAKPVTFSDLENVLKIFKDKYTRENNAPLYLASAGFSFGYSLMGGFNVAGLQYLNIDGKVHYSPTEPGFKDYLMKLNDWYNKGLIDPDSVSTPVVLMPTDLVTNDDIGVYDYIYTFSSIYKMSAVDPNYHLVALTTPIPDGKTAADVHVRQNNDWIRTGNSMAISTTCENVELACKYWDYFFSDDGILLSNYGVEGKSFEYDAEGKPQYTKDVLAYNNITYTQVKYCLHNQPVYTIWSRECSVLDDDQKAAEGIWGQVDAAYIMPQGVTLTEEEGAEHSGLKSTMDTFVQENAAKFIIGQKSFDEYDKFIEDLKGLGVDRAVEIEQTALDRYLARS
jgi:putative aldouronate transport system substrate-binding protein